MKRFINILMCAVSLIVVHSCINDDIEFVADVTEGDFISIDISSGALQTRAVADNGLEAAVSHVDVLIFQEDGAFKYSERIAVNAPQGTVRLSTNRRDVFGENEKYFVYVIANSTLDHSAFSSLADIDALHALKQEDERIHITGSSVEGAPHHFLMDGAAFLQPGTEPAEPQAIVLYDGNDSETTKLKVNLRRAAAKVVIRLMKGDKVTFNQNAHVGYYLRNMPYSTTVIPLANASDNPNAQLRTPDKTTGRYFSWSSGMVEVTAYLYSHAWEGSESFTRGTSLIVNVPLTFEGISYENCYYQIALRPSESLKFDRNHHYVVTGIINAPGAEEEDVPVVIDDLNYTVRDWDVVNVDVNGENAPVYLTVNRDVLKMHNLPLDETTLQFSSSSDVSARIISNASNYPYYIDKFGQVQRYTGGGITCNAEGISGNITVSSPVPTNNTIRYFMVEVSNEEGLKDTVIVEQYPLIYITNQQGWYSYRDDFKDDSALPTTYENRGDRYVNVSFTRQYVGGSYTNPEYAYGYSYGRDYDEGFWRSKMAEPLENGMSNIYYYKWNTYGTAPSTKSAESGGNARMYHVRVTSTSASYKVGRPRMTADGYTDSGDDNAELVSPSFMIASRLGFINSSEGGIGYANTDDLKIELYRNHCANYVEVYKDDDGNKVVLDDWRLPTTAELEIIMDIQGTGNDAEAIDYLLNAQYYVSASGPVRNSKNKTQGTAGRCVRDAYEE